MRIVLIAYLIFGSLVCGWFTTAAYRGWRFPTPPSSGAHTQRSGTTVIYGGGSRSSGGSWGGGK